MPQQVVPIPAPSRHYNALVAAPAQNLVYRGGRLLTSVQIEAVFWGDDWQNDPTASALVPQIDDFLNWIVSSPLIDQLGEYSTPTQAITHGDYFGYAGIPGAVNASISDNDVRDALTNLWTTEPALDQNALWIVFTPPNVQVSAFNEQSCVDFCGYHLAVNGIAYAVLPFPDCAPCLGGLAAFDSLTSVISHEVCESITDPFADGWYAPNGYEIGDLCAVPMWQEKQLNGYTVQQEWSNQQSGCV